MTFQSTWLLRLAAHLLLGVVLLAPLAVHGTEMVGPPEQPPPADAANMFDRPRDYLSGRFVTMVSNIDRFFGDDRNYQETNDSVLQFDLVRVIGYNGERKFVFSGRAKVHLPSSEQRLHLVLETNPDKNAIVNPAQTQTPPLKQPDSPESYAAALRYEKAEAERWHFSTDGGLKFQGLNTAPFARSRLSLDAPLAQWRIKIAEAAFWFNTTGAGESTQLDLERIINEPILFRSTSNATWLNDSQNFNLRQDLAVFHQINERTALMYQASAIGVSNPQTVVTDYVVLLLCRYRLHRNWTFIEVSPQLHFPRARAYHANSLLYLRLEFLLDESR